MPNPLKLISDTYFTAQDYIINRITPVIRSRTEIETEKLIQAQQKAHDLEIELEKTRALLENKEDSTFTIVRRYFTRSYCVVSGFLSEQLRPVRKRTNQKFDEYITQADIKESIGKKVVNADEARKYVSDLLRYRLGEGFIGTCMSNYVDGLFGAVFSWPKLFEVLSKSPKARAVFVQSVVDNFCNYLFFVAAAQWLSEDSDDDEQKSSYAAALSTIFSVRLLLRYLILNMTLNSAVAKVFSEFRPHEGDDEKCECASSYSLTALVRSPAHYVVNMVVLMGLTNLNFKYVPVVFAVTMPVFWGRAVGGTRRAQCLEHDNEFWAEHNLYAHGLGTAMLLTTGLIDSVFTAALGKNAFVSDAIFSAVYQWFMMLVLLDPTKRKKDPFRLNFTKYINVLADKIVGDILPMVDRSIHHPRQRNMAMKFLFFALSSPNREILLGHDFHNWDTAILNRSIRLALQAHAIKIQSYLGGIYDVTEQWEFYAAKKANVLFKFMSLPPPHPGLNLVTTLNRMRKDDGKLSNVNLIAGMSRLKMAQEDLDKDEEKFKDAKISGTAEALKSAATNENYDGKTSAEIPIVVKLDTTLKLVNYDEQKQNQRAHDEKEAALLHAAEEEKRKKLRQVEKEKKKQGYGVFEDYDDTVQTVATASGKKKNK